MDTKLVEGFLLKEDGFTHTFLILETIARCCFLHCRWEIKQQEFRIPIVWSSHEVYKIDLWKLPRARSNPGCPPNLPSGVAGKELNTLHLVLTFLIWATMSISFISLLYFCLSSTSCEVLFHLFRHLDVFDSYLPVAHHSLRWTLNPQLLSQAA